MSVTTLAGTTWQFNDVLTPIQLQWETQTVFAINGSINNNTFTAIMLQTSGNCYWADPLTQFYSSSSGWGSSSAAQISFTDGTDIANADLITWMEANATQVLPSYIVEGASLTAVADAIRAKGATSAPLTFPSGFVSAISAISGGGSGYTIDDLATGQISGSISGSATSITPFAFAGTKITGASFPSATSIGSNAFYMCGSLTTISCPAVVSIGSSAFVSCSKLTTISFSEATFAGSSAFYYCSSLQTVSLPKLSFVGYMTFGYCFKLSTISLPGVTSLNTYAFYNCSSLTTVDFSSCTSIGGYAFNYCFNLTTVSFPNCTSIGTNAFFGCSKLSTITLPSISYIGANVFNNCSALSMASFPIVRTISTSVFYNCYNLLSLYLYSVSAVPSLGNSVFNNTPIGGRTTSTGGVYGSIYVPESLYSSFITATNWASVSSRIVSIGALT